MRMTVKSESNLEALERLKLCRALMEWRCRLSDRGAFRGCVPWTHPYTECADFHAEVCGFLDNLAMYDWMHNPR